MMNLRIALLAGAALLSTPVLAQDAQPAPQTVTPPPIMVTPAPAPAPAAPAPRVMEMAPQSPIVQPAPPPGPRAEDVAAAERAAAARPARSAAPVRAARAPAAEPAAPTAAAPAPAAPAPVAADPAATSTAGAAGAPPAETAPVAPTVTDTTTQTTRTGTAWPLMVGGILLVLAGAVALLLLRRRRAEPDYVEDRVYEAPVETASVYAPEPVAAAAAAPIAPALVEPAIEPNVEATPVEAHAEAELAEPDREELAGVADAPAPVANRPWLEFGLRPVRAGTSEEEAVVDVELTVGNAGDQAARDVRISTFMLADADDGEMERLLTGHRSDAAVPPVTIAPGDGTRVDAHLAVPKGELGHTFNPVVVAEARYTLPDGREGRTSAAFKIGRPAPDLAGVGAIGASRPHLVEDVEAELLGVPEHA